MTLLQLNLALEELRTEIYRFQKELSAETVPANFAREQVWLWSNRLRNMEADLQV